MQTGQSGPNYKRLRAIQHTAVIAGVLMLGISAYLLEVFSNPQIATVVMALAFTGIAFSAVFYFGCLIFEGSLQKYIVSDDTEIKGERVEMVTTTAPSGDETIDDWVGRYVFARNLFGMSVIPLLLLGGLYFFG